MRVDHTQCEFIERLKPVWSDAKHGIEFGVSHTTDQRKFHPGERVPLAMFVRNTGDAPLKVSLTADFYWNVLELQDARGVSIPVERAELQELNHVYCETLKPGEAFGFLHQGLGLHDGKPRPVPFSQRHLGLEETSPFWKIPVAGAYKLRQTKEITIEGLKDTVTFRGPLTSGTVDFEVIESAPDAEKVSGIAKPLDRQNARAVVEAFVAAALAGDGETVITLAKLNRREPRTFRFHPQFPPTASRPGLVWRSGYDSPSLPMRGTPADRQPGDSKTASCGGGDTAGLAAGPHPFGPAFVVKN